MYDTIPTYGESLNTYMKYGSIFTVHRTGRTGQDGTGRDRTGRHLNLLILVRIEQYILCHSPIVRVGTYHVQTHAQEPTLLII